MNAFGGVVETDGYYSTAVNPKKPDISLSLNIVNASFAQTFNQLDFVKKLMPLFEKTIGNYSVNVKLNGKLDEHMSPDLKTLLAQGLLQSQNVQVKEVKALDALALAMKDDKYKNVSMKDLKLPFSIQDGKVITKPFDIQMGDTKINLSGITTLDKMIQYDGTITLPEGAVSKLGVNIQQVAFKIGGTFTQPKVSLDYKSMAKSLVKEAVTKGIQKALGVKDDAELQAKIAAARQEARAKADQIIEQADQQAQALIDKAGNPIAKIAAKKVAEQLKKEAQKKAQTVVDDAEARVVQMQTK
jgi:vacuolar-type H+-ATPase subunit H